MKVDVYSVMHNEERILPYWLRHYATFASRIFVWDDQSTDATRKILSQNNLVTFLPMDKHGDDDDYWVTSLFPQYEKYSRNKADWVIIADADEFIYHPQLLKSLEKLTQAGIEVLQCGGYSMISDSFPTTSGQICDQIKLGLPDRRESKWTVHTPSAHIRYRRGRHGPVRDHRNVRFNRFKYHGIKLLHYRFLGEEYLEQRNRKIWQRRQLIDKQLTGEYSSSEKHTCPDGTKSSLLEWFSKHKGEATNVVDNP